MRRRRRRRPVRVHLLARSAEQLKPPTVARPAGEPPGAFALAFPTSLARTNNRTLVAAALCLLIKSTVCLGARHTAASICALAASQFGSEPRRASKKWAEQEEEAGLWMARLAGRQPVRERARETAAAPRAGRSLASSSLAVDFSPAQRCVGLFGKLARSKDVSIGHTHQLKRRRGALRFHTPLVVGRQAGRQMNSRTVGLLSLGANPQVARSHAHTTWRPCCLVSFAN